MGERLVGIDVGGTKMLGVAVDRDRPAAILDRSLVPTPSNAREVVATINDLARSLGVERHLGLGLAGLVEDGAVLRAAPNLMCMIDVSARDEVEKELGVEVRLDNDATCALIAEMTLGVATDAEDVVMVTMGTGIGGGVAVGGRIVRGAHGFAGEPGHMCVDPAGPLCVCGRRGCWERYASGAGLVWLAAERGLSGAADGGAMTGEQLATLARSGDEDARAVWEDFADWLALGLANIADILDPELLVLGGGLVSSTDLFIDRARSRFGAGVLGGRARRRTRIEAAGCGAASGAIGAALLH